MSSGPDRIIPLFQLIYKSTRIPPHLTSLPPPIKCSLSAYRIECVFLYKYSECTIQLLSYCPDTPNVLERDTGGKYSNRKMTQRYFAYLQINEFSQFSFRSWPESLSFSSSNYNANMLNLGFFKKHFSCLIIFCKQKQY